MITKKHKKSKSKKSRKRSIAARKGWLTRKLKEQQRIRELEKELEQARERLKQVESELKTLPEIKSAKRHLTRKEMIDQFLDRAERLYGSGPGLLDTAKDLADYYEIDIDQIFDEWYEETG
jgi:hypothetical protein